MAREAAKDRTTFKNTTTNYNASKNKSMLVILFCYMCETNAFSPIFSITHVSQPCTLTDIYKNYEKYEKQNWSDKYTNVHIVCDCEGAQHSFILRNNVLVDIHWGIDQENIRYKSCILRELKRWFSCENPLKTLEAQLYRGDDVNAWFER